MYIPPGFGTVTPYVFAKHADRLVQFLIAGLGGLETCRTERDGVIANCQVTIGTTTLMISEATEQFPPSQASFYLYVEDAERSMSRAVNAGATVIMEVADMPYGDRQGGVSDPAGNLWWVSQRLISEPYSA